MQQLSASRLAAWLAGAEAEAPAEASRPQPLLLDVREPWEYELCHLPGSTLMPMHTVPVRISELDADAAIVVICHHGGRSMQVGMFLERNGFSSIYNLAGGVAAWAADVDPAMRQY